MSAKPQRDPFEQRFERSLDHFDDSVARAYSLKQTVKNCFIEIQALQFGDNPLDKIQEIRSGIVSGKYRSLTLLDSSQAKKLPEVDLVGWTKNYPLLIEKFHVIDEALSFVPDIITNFIKILVEADSLNKVHVNLQQPNTMQPATLVKEREGILSKFRNWISSIKPQYKQDFEKGMGIMSTTIERFNDAVRIWEEYKSYYKENQARCLLYDNRAMYPYLLLQDELLMRDMGIILQAIDKGVRLDLVDLRKVLSEISNNILQAKAMQMQQQQMQSQALNKFQ